MMRSVFFHLNSLKLFSSVQSTEDSMEETDDDYLSLFPLLKSTLRGLTYAINPTQPLRFPSFFFFFFILFTFSFSNIPSAISSVSSSNFEINYAEHCNHIIPKLPLTVPATGIDKILRFDIGYFTGGVRILGQNLPQPTVGTPKGLTFSPVRKYMTESDGVYKIEAALKFRLPFSLSGNFTHRRFRNINFRGPRIPVKRGSEIFHLHGYWSASSGKLCMVGSGSRLSKFRSTSVVLKLNYPKNSSIISSLVSGIFESLDVQGSLNYFEPITILGVRQYDEAYEYTRAENSVCFSGYDGVDKGLSPDTVFTKGVCSMLNRFNNNYRLEYGSDCDTGSCNPLIRTGAGDLPNSVLLRVIRCSEERKMLMLLEFHNSTYNRYSSAFDPNTTFLAEGQWDKKNNVLCAVGCRILNTSISLLNAFVGDCSTRLSLRFPAVFSLNHRSTVDGQIWSSRSVNDSSYFGKLLFRGSDDGLMDSMPGLTYKYTMIEKVRQFCARKKTDKRMGKTYPDVRSSDMRFYMSVKNSDGKKAGGYSSPLFVGDQPYGRQYFSKVSGSAVQVRNSIGSLLNVSYKLSFSPLSHFKVNSKISLNAPVEISAEGTYDTETGVLCMIGCWNLGSDTKNLVRNGSVDCEISVNVQFRPLSPNAGGNVKGTIKSMRDKVDPLHFESLELSSTSIYTTQAKESIWRMDMEITMVLISNTLACVFVGMQLLHVKKNPDVVPFISFNMLLLLTLGHMIPLLLNFEALFLTNHNRQNVFFSSGGWLEVNEVIVRVVMMVAFLLEFRLLQLTWSARHDERSQNGLWVSEMKVLYVCLPLYIGGALIAWFVHQWKNSHQSLIASPFQVRYGIKSYQQHNSIWRDLRSYAGLVMDGFLLPQIIFNLFFNSKEKALAFIFYAGTTFVRLLPHAYDLYRAHSSSWSLDLSYIYANHKWDFFSTFWDIIIPLGGLLFAVLTYFQQRFGGNCILPERLRGGSAYEKVSTVSSEEVQELQMEAVR